MYPKYLFIPLLFASLASVTGAAFSAPPAGTAATARVRVFQDAVITLYPGEYCYSPKNPQLIRAADGEPSMFSFYKKIGMPVTENMPSAYNEYLIEANKPMTVLLQWQADKNGVIASCGPTGVTFFPQAGKDYDVSMGYAGNCFVQVRELYETTPGKAAARPAPSGYSFACAPN